MQLSRYEEIVQKYKDPIRAMVHKTLEVYIDEAFEEFIGDKIGIYVRRASDNNMYIQVDTVYITVKKLANTRLGIMIAIGIDEDGHKEVLYFRIGTEKTIHSDEVFQNLIQRGLDVNAVKLVTTDGARGPINSIIAVFGEEKLQRCVVHKTENILKKCPKNIRAEMKAKLQRL